MDRDLLPGQGRCAPEHSARHSRALAAGQGLQPSCDHPAASMFTSGPMIESLFMDLHIWCMHLKDGLSVKICKVLMLINIRRCFELWHQDQLAISINAIGETD